MTSPSAWVAPAHVGNHAERVRISLREASAMPLNAYWRFENLDALARRGDPPATKRSHRIRLGREPVPLPRRFGAGRLYMPRIR